MATITRRMPLPVGPDVAWAAVRDVGNAHRLFPGVLSGCTMERDVRVVTFADGTVVRELVVTVDDEARRLAYAVQDRFRHHHASLEVLPGDGGCELVWITDVLPAEAAERVGSLMDAGFDAAAAVLAASTG